MTRAPFAPREAGRFLEENVLSYFEVLAVSVDDYKAVLKSCSAAGLIGGAVYDALHLHVAEKVGCERVYTFNLKDFRALASPTMAGKIAAP